ncbi:MAG TPA: lysophospholipid acyltransferase family protein [Planctomycetota bacterium]
MRSARVLLRLLVLVPWSAACFALWLVVALPAALVGRLASSRARVQHLWSRGMCALLGVRLQVCGTPPRGGTLLVSNHLSYLDILVLAALFPCTFVSKAEVARWPVIGFLARAMGTVFLERERKRTLAGVNEVLAARLARGQALVIFPEGTSTSGADVLAFRPALLEPAVALGLPVHFAALQYATAPGERPASEVVCWWGDMTFGSHLLGLLALPGVEASIVFGAEPLRATDRKELALRLRRAVVESLRPPSSPCLIAVP